MLSLGDQIYIGIQNFVCLKSLGTELLHRAFIFDYCSLSINALSWGSHALQWIIYIGLYRKQIHSCLKPMLLGTYHQLVTNFM